MDNLKKPLFNAAHAVRKIFVMTRKLLWIVLVWSWIASASAGELVLNNGDRVAGELDGYLNNTISWKSDNFGVISVAANQIKELKTSSVISINDSAEACRWESLEQWVLTYNCEQSGRGTMPLADVVAMGPYVSPDWEPAPKFEGKVTATGRRASGNKEEEELEVTSKTLYEVGDYRHTLNFDFESNSKNEEDAEEQLDVKYALDWFFAERWFLYGEAQFNYDETRNIDERYILGPGVGYQILATNSTSFSVQGGVDYVKENFAEPDMVMAMPMPPMMMMEFDSSRERAAYRLGMDFTHIFSNDISIYHNNQYIESTNNSSDWVFESETGISIPLVGSLYTEVKLDYDIDNLPPEARERSDTELTVGLGYAW